MKKLLKNCKIKIKVISKSFLKSITQTGMAVLMPLNTDYGVKEEKEKQRELIIKSKKEGQEEKHVTKKRLGCLLSQSQKLVRNLKRLRLYSGGVGGGGSETLFP